MAIPKASTYKARAQEMRKMAERAQTESQRLAFLRLEASWRRLADQAEKAVQGEDENGEEEG